MGIARKIIRKAFEKTLAGILGKEIGRKKRQKFFEKMYLYSLHGMNIGLGDNYATSGEKHVLEIVLDKLKGILLSYLM